MVEGHVVRQRGKKLALEMKLQELRPSWGRSPPSPVSSHSHLLTPGLGVAHSKCLVNRCYFCIIFLSNPWSFSNIHSDG